MIEQNENKVLTALGGRIKLEDLVGQHWLAGVEPGVRLGVGTVWSNGEANTLAFILGEVAYIAVEDPDDGYRSSLGTLEMALPDVIKPDYWFMPVAVTAKMRVYDMDRPHEMCDILDFTDDLTGEVVLSIGTDNTDDYYPMCVLQWNPKGLCLNKKVDDTQTS